MPLTWSFQSGLLAAHDVLHILLRCETIHELEVIHDVLRHQHLVHLPSESFSPLAEGVCLLAHSHVLLHLDLLQELLPGVGLGPSLLPTTTALLALFRRQSDHLLILDLFLRGIGLVLVVRVFRLVLFDEIVLSAKFLAADLRHLRIEAALLLQVAVLVVVGFPFEVCSLVLAHGLPLAAHLLHHLQCPHVWVGVDNFRPRLR